MTHQTNFFTLLSDTQWVQIRENSTHRVFKPGQRFLVVSKLEDEFLLCWQDGIKPRHAGTLLHQGCVEPIESCYAVPYTVE